MIAVFEAYNKSISKLCWEENARLLYTIGTDKMPLHKGKLTNSFKIWLLPNVWYGIVHKEREEIKGRIEENASDKEDDLIGWDNTYP